MSLSAVILSAANTPEVLNITSAAQTFLHSWGYQMNWTARRKPIFFSGLALFTLDLLLYAAALLRTPRIDPTSTEFFVYFFGGIALNLVALPLSCFGSGWKRTTVLLSSLALAYCWISYIGIEVMKH